MNADSGPGTDVCGKCGGVKEASRRNSRACRTCNGQRASRSTADLEAMIADMTARLDRQAAAIRTLRERVARLENKGEVTC